MRSDRSHGGTGVGSRPVTRSHTTDQASARFLQAGARRAFWLRTKQGDRVAFSSSVESKNRDILGVDRCHRMKGYLGQYGEACKLVLTTLEA